VVLPIAAGMFPSIPFRGSYPRIHSVGDRRRISEAELNKIRALIIDDSFVMRKIVERSLRQAGIDLAEVREAGNGAEGLKALQTSGVDLILCDIYMPVMDGIEFLRQLQSVPNAKGVPIVVITAESRASHVVQALLIGARGYLRKPFTPEQVKEHVLPLLGAAK
jgi:two-component system, chemotaxis family, chemotaxis protein CheY